MTADAEKKQPLNSDGPETWNDETTPFTVVRHYRRGHVTDERSRAFLRKNPITLLPKLLKNIALLGSIMLEDTSQEISDNITTTLNRTKTKGQLEFDETCIDKESLNLFAPAVVSVDEGSLPYHQTRNLPFTKVMGPSGSGKTMFCLQDLPKRLFPSASLEKDIFRVHLRADQLIGKKKGNVNLSISLANHVKEIVAGSMSPRRCQP